jgi:L-ascorbate metabolism protein UlaG (beta-lactamase superfamily)
MKWIVVLALALPAFCQSPRPVQELATNAGTVRITPIQHASLVIEGGGQVLYIDPALPGANYDGLPQADLIFITDIHGDHMDPKAITRVRKASTVIFAPEAVLKTVTDATAIKNGETKTAGKWSVEAVPMYNLKRGPAEGRLYHDKGRGNGYVLTFGGRRIYISGDTEGTPEMAALRNIDVAFLCMNLPYTMPPDEAAEAVKAFKPKTVYPYHYRGQDPAAFEKALAGTGVQVKLIDWYYKM